MPPVPRRHPGLEARQTPAEAACSVRHATALANALERPITPGNRVDALIDAPSAYAAMLDAIEAARDHINIESHLVEADGPARELARRLLAKRREGVRVNLLLGGMDPDGTCSRYFTALRKAGVQLCEYRPPSVWRHPLGHALHARQHRKLLIVDGRVAITGGLDGSSIYPVPSQALGTGGDSPARDTHVRLEGPVVATLQRLFLDHWCSQSRSAAQRARYFPPLAAAGEQQVAVAACDDHHRHHPSLHVLLRAVESAEQRIWLTADCFAPPRRLLRALASAARRGVDVRLVLPGGGKSALWPVHRGHYAELLAAGVRIFERREALPHAQTAVIDGVWSTLGAGKLDWRSVLHTAEANVVVLDPTFGARLEEVFRQDLFCSHEVLPTEWRERGWHARASEWLAARLDFLP